MGHAKVSVLLGKVFLLVPMVHVSLHQLPLSITNHLRRPYQRYLTESVGRMEALVTSAERGRTGRGRLGREEKNAVAASESIINDMGGEILSKVVCEYTRYFCICLVCTHSLCGTVFT